MTRKQSRQYALGFITKCAEAGLTSYEAGQLYAVKQAQWGGAATGAAVGSLFGPLGPLVGAGLGWGMGNMARKGHMYQSSDDYIRNQLRKSNPRMEGYMDQIDSGKAGTGIGRFWHGMMDNAVGRAFGIRGTDKYREDMNNRRIDRAKANMQKDIDEQNRYAERLGTAPQGNGLQVSRVSGQENMDVKSPQKIQTVAGQQVGTQPNTTAQPQQQAAPAATSGYQRVGSGMNRMQPA